MELPQGHLDMLSGAQRRGSGYRYVVSNLEGGHELDVSPTEQNRTERGERKVLRKVHMFTE